MGQVLVGKMGKSAQKGRSSRKRAKLNHFVHRVPGSAKNDH
jgi:hypothetical protein